VLDALREPLLHLLRNAVDHGLEKESDRERVKKPARGEVRVEARVAGANVELLVSDDGRGIDIDSIRERARQHGLSVEGMGDGELIDQALFAAGFSTAERVTNYSGRGVGLDVVRSRVAELG